MSGEGFQNGEAQAGHLHPCHTVSPTLRPTLLLRRINQPSLPAAPHRSCLHRMQAWGGRLPLTYCEAGLSGSGLGPTDRVSSEGRVGGVVCPEVGVVCTGGWPVGPHSWLTCRCPPSLVPADSPELPVSFSWLFRSLPGGQVGASRLAQPRGEASWSLVGGNCETCPLAKIKRSIQASRSPGSLLTSLASTWDRCQRDYSPLLLHTLRLPTFRASLTGNGSRGG